MSALVIAVLFVLVLALVVLASHTDHLDADERAHERQLLREVRRYDRAHPYDQDDQP